MTQALLILCDDGANLQKIAAGMRGIPGVKEVRLGTLQREHVIERKVGIFFPQVGKATAPPGIEIGPSGSD